MRTDLRLVAVGDITERFLVPSYQRGYRWGAHEVRALLDDISTIRETEDYCLQPIVVKKLDDGRLELVDGQQRLTTLYLIFLFMQQEGFKKSGPPFSLAYETRPDSAAFLADLDPDRKHENIDFFHLANAFDCIATWFEGHAHRAELVANKMYTHLYERVKVIWYEAEADVSSAALFARLNVGRIPLTSAELIKALLLRRDEDVAPHRAREIAMQWDAVEQRLRRPEFWAFVTNRSSSAYPTRIELLFDSMVETKGIDRLHTFHHFKDRLAEGETRDALWQQLLARMDLFEEWYDDRDLYHWIGYLIAIGRDTELRTLVRQGEGLTKSAFRASLHARIVSGLDLTRDAIESLEYENAPVQCRNVLLLHNVESSRLLTGSSDRYPFHLHKSEAWSLEHIHAQRAEALVRKEQWQTWLREHLAALRQLRLDDPADRDALIEDIEANVQAPTKEAFERLAPRVIAMFELVEVEPDLHDIANLALLSSAANSALNNSVFEVKRQRILELDRAGKYIPICTRRVFLKYYTASADQQLQFWSRQDREAYLDAMFDAERGVLTPYLKADA